MKSIPLRAQLGLVAAGYAVVLVTAALLVYARHLQYVNHPEDVAASSGMYAAGDWMLEIIIGFMLLVPTFVLVLVIRKSEHLYAEGNMGTDGTFPDFLSCGSRKSREGGGCGIPPLRKRPRKDGAPGMKEPCCCSRKYRRSVASGTSTEIGVDGREAGELFGSTPATCEIVHLQGL